MRNLNEVKNYFVYHAPDEVAREKHERIGNMFITVAEMLWELVPPENAGSPDKTVMFRELSRARMEANMAVACFIPPISNNSDDLGTARADVASETPVPGPGAARSGLLPPPQ